MLSGLLFVITPLILGYLVKTQRVYILKKVDESCQLLVLIILALMGLSLAKMDQLGQNIAQILQIAAVLFVCISLCNLLALPILDKLTNKNTQGKKAKIPFKSALQSSSKLVATVAIGLGFGLTIESYSANSLDWVDSASEGVLFILLMLIGINLRNSAMPLKQMLLNIHGMVLALWVIISSLVGGMIAATCLGIPLNQGLAMASGFGWYSLTGILVSDHLGPILGSAAFLNELLRELVALVMIPILIGRYPSTAIGYAGATAMDFTLPVIQQSGGNNCVPTAIISGFILSILVPILVVTFASW